MTNRHGIETRQFTMHADLYQRIVLVRDAMQARAGIRSKITLQNAVQELLDEYEKTSALMRDLGVKP
jgi:hypothetical protein